MKLHNIIYFIGFAFLVFLISSTFIIHSFTYESLINFILNEINRKDLYEIITTKFFTKEKFILVTKVSILISIFSFIMLIFYFKQKKIIISSLKYVIEKLKKSFNHFKNELTNNKPITNKLLVFSLLLILARSIYFALDNYIQYDEAWNYNYFLHKNIVYTLFAYNNYPLHNIVTWFFVKLLPMNTFVLRLPSIILGIISSVFVFVIIKKLFKNELTAIITMLVYASLPISITYMLCARGVIFELFFVLLVFYFLMKFVQEEFTINRVLFISVFNALGTFSMLSHAYFIAFSSLAFFIILLIEKKYSMLKYGIYYGLFSVIFSLILLSPMLLGTGASLGINAGLKKMSYLVIHYDLPLYCYSLFFTGNKFLLLLFIFANIGILFFKNKTYHRLMIFNAVIFSSIFLIPLLTNAILAERTFGMLILIPILTSAIYLNKLISVSISIVYIIFLNYITPVSSYFNWSKKLDELVNNVSDVLLKNNITNITNNSAEFAYFSPGIAYYYNLQQKSIEYKTTIINSTRYVERIKNSSCVAVDKSDSTIKGNVIYSDKIIKIIIPTN